MINLDFIGCASLAGLYALWAYPYRYYRIDKTRSRLFELRSELFDMGSHGELDFDSEAYRAAEKILNALINQTHKLDLMRLFFYRLLMWGNAPSGKCSQELHRAVDQYPDPRVRNKLIAILELAEMQAILHVATSVLPGWIIMESALRIFHLEKKLQSLSQERLKPQIQRIEEEGLITA